MDEPSAPLTAKELDRLFAVIGELKRAGCGVLYISHRLEELHRVGSIATVLRDGGLVGTYPLPDTPLRSIVAAMIGGEPETASDRQLVAEEGPPILDVRSVVVPQACEIEGVRVWPGEIVGIAGLVGSGEDDVPAGPVRRGPGARGRRLRRSAVPPEGPGRRHRVGGGPRARGPPPPGPRRGPLRRRQPRACVAPAPVAVRVRRARPGRRVRAAAASRRSRSRRPNPRVRAGTLSGGNQQRIVLGKWMGGESACSCSTSRPAASTSARRPSSSASSARIASQGVAMLVASSEIDEMLPNCDRIARLLRGPTRGRVPARRAEPDRDRQRHGHGPGTRED